MARKLHPKLEVGQEVNGRLVVAEIPRDDQRHRRFVLRCLSCGREAVLADSNARRRRCQCRGSTTTQRLGFVSGAWGQVIYTAARGAARRGLRWSLTVEQYRDLAQRSCFYCGSPPATRRIVPGGRGSHAALLLAHGIDRYDNEQGYDYENCVPCCTDCNVAKRNMPAEDFIRLAQRIVDYQQSPRGQRRKAEFLAAIPVDARPRAVLRMAHEDLDVPPLLDGQPGQPARTGHAP